MPLPIEMDEGERLLREKRERDARVAREARIRQMLTPAGDGTTDVEIGPAQVDGPPSYAEAMRAPMTQYAAPPTGHGAIIDDDTARRIRRQEAAREVAEGMTQRRFREADAPRAERQRRDREASYRDDPIFALAIDATDPANAYQAGVAQGATLGFSDEIAGLGGALSPTDTYAGARDRSRRENAAAREAAPGWYAGGEIVGSLAPGMLVPGATAESALGRVAQSTLYGAGYGAVEGLGRGEGDALDQLGSMARTSAMGGAFGAGGQMIAELPGAVRALRGEDESFRLLPDYRRGRVIEPEYTPEQMARIRQDAELRALEDQRSQTVDRAAESRVMSVGGAGATSTDLRRAADYPGGLRSLARDIREEGIVRPDDGPLGGLLPASSDTAQQRARFLAQDAGERIGQVEGRVHDAGAPNVDRLDAGRSQVARLGTVADDVAPSSLTPEQMARADAWRTAEAERNRVWADAERADRARRARANMNAEEGTAPQGGRGRVPAAVREQQAANELAREAESRAIIADTQERIATRDAPVVDMRRVAERLRREAAQIRAGNSPQAIRRADDLDALADHYAQSWEVRLGTPRRGDPGIEPLDEAADAALGPRSPEVTARGMLDQQRSEAGYGARNADVTRPWAEEQARLAQRAIREEMDAAMARTLPPEEMQQALRDRRSYQTAQAVQAMDARAGQRRAGNRQVSPTEYAATLGAQTIPGKLAAAVANRLLRGREHAFMAGFREHEANALAREITRRLEETGQRTLAAQLSAEVRRRGAASIGSTLRRLEEADDTRGIVSEAMATATPEAAQRIAELEAQAADPAGGLDGTTPQAPTDAPMPEEDEDWEAIAADPTGGLR